MMRTYSAKKENIERKWYLVDAAGKTVGRMAAGVAVITSAVSCLPEVAGDGALLVDPQSVGEIRSSLEKVMTSPVTVEHLGRNGAERARSFTWENCARQSWAFFERVCGG